MIDLNNVEAPASYQSHVTGSDKAPQGERSKNDVFCERERVSFQGINLNSKRLLSDRINDLIDSAFLSPLEVVKPRRASEEFSTQNSSDSECHTGRMTERHMKKEEPRTYLGCSVLGAECERSVQYEAIRAFYPASHGELTNDFPPRVRRIFKRGFLFEDEAIKWFQNAGFHLITRNEKGEQLDCEWFGGQLGGHLDGIFVFYNNNNIAPFDLPALWEHKCVNERNFKLVIKDKVKKAFPKYYAQTQMYMNGYNLKQGIVTFTNANTMELHHELVMYDDGEFQSLLRRAERVINATHRGEILPRGGKSPAHFICRFCNYTKVCWA